MPVTGYRHGLVRYRRLELPGGIPPSAPVDLAAWLAPGIERATELLALLQRCSAATPGRTGLPAPLKRRYLH
jgi:hypothetical protein